MLDCGALAALACEGLRGRGIPALQTQLIRFYGRLNGVQWSEIWRDDNIPSGWVEDAFVYHEVCAVLQDGERKIEIWDPTGNYWIDPSQVVGYSSPVAIRVVGQDYLDYHVEEPLQWGSYHLKPNEWLLLI
jgi:hypothetical protein